MLKRSVVRRSKVGAGEGKEDDEMRIRIGSIEVAQIARSSGV